MNVRIMSFNIRCAEFTPERIDLVIHMVNKYKPDSVGFQEATDAWISTLTTRLGDEYAYISCGRNANRFGEATPIFYLKSRFNLIDSDTKWLSHTPDEAGSKFSEAALPRIFTYTILEDIVTEEKFIHVNTHLDHKNEKARKMQIEILLNYMKGFDNPDLPYILTGDFNCSSDSETYFAILNFGLTDSSSIAAKSEKGTTYHEYGTTDQIIDFIFVQSEKTTVDFYRSCSETFKNDIGETVFPSDHNPIIIDAKILG